MSRGSEPTHYPNSSHPDTGQFIGETHKTGNPFEDDLVTNPIPHDDSPGEIERIDGEATDPNSYRLPDDDDDER